jgi:two-component system, NarL family, response regulator LiaR
MTDSDVTMEEPVERLRVIICDDDPLVRRFVRDALELSGIIVIAEASNGREAIELTRFYHPEVVLMDVVMPGMDGIEATRRITAEAPGTRVVMLTGSGDDELALLGLRAGAVGYLTKDISVPAIPRALRGANAGEAVVSRRLAMKLIERLRMVPEAGVGIRPVRSVLTPREWEVLDLLCGGESTDSIADTLVLSPETVRSHVKNLLHKLGVRSREEAVALAGNLRAASPPPDGGARKSPS